MIARMDIHGWIGINGGTKGFWVQLRSRNAAERAENLQRHHYSTATETQS